MELSCPSLFLLLSMLVGFFIQSSTADVDTYVYALCPDLSTVAPSSRYQTNVNTLFSIFSSNFSKKYHFYNTTVGRKPDIVHGLYTCRADVTSDACQKCVSLATNALNTRCPGKKSSKVWYFDQCEVRYSNESFFGTMTDAPMIAMWNRQNTLDIWNATSNMTGFMEVLVRTMGEATARVTSRKQKGRFATKDARFEANLTSSNTLYTTIGCTPDITLGDCQRCLDMVIGNTSRLCNEKAGCTLMCPNCNMRYDIYPFYGDATLASSGLYAVPSPTGAPKAAAKGKRPLTIGIISAAILVALLLIFTLIVVCRRRPTKCNELKDIKDVESLKFDFSAIRSATNSFSEGRKLGEGGFGEVFKGKLDSGQEVAVKRLSTNSSQGIAEFKTEVLLVAKLQHRNLVKILGFCLSKSEKLLVYEYLPNLSLDQILFDPKKSRNLDWETRYKIICGIAKGLLYLHEDSRLKIIHRDLKASNVLLDKDMNPKISDFGMARLFGTDETQGNTNRIAGTFGYMAPEYLITGHFSTKSDVYSFGVLILEIISGQRNKFFKRQQNEESLIHRAWHLWTEGLTVKLVDPTLGKKFSYDEVVKCIHIGILCIQEDAAQRPRMASVVAALNGDSITLPLPTPPHFFNMDMCDETQESEPTDTFTGSKDITAVDPR